MLLFKPAVPRSADLVARVMLSLKGESISTELLGVAVE